MTNFGSETTAFGSKAIAFGGVETAFGGVLRHFVLGGSDLHDDDDSRQIRVITDDEKPFVIYGDQRRDD